MKQQYHITPSTLQAAAQNPNVRGEATVPHNTDEAADESRSGVLEQSIGIKHSEGVWCTAVGYAYTVPLLCVHSDSIYTQIYSTDELCANSLPSLTLNY